MEYCYLDLDRFLDMASKRANKDDVTPPSTPSKDELCDKDARRNCQFCKARMSSVLYDKHILCSACRGGECALGSKCKECMTWTDDDFARYLKHRKSLDTKNKNRKSKDGSLSKSKSFKEKEREQRDDLLLGSGSETGSVVLGDENIGLDLGLGSGGPISRSEILDLVNSSIDSFGNSFRSEVSGHLKSAFEDISALLDRRLGSEDVNVTNRSFTAPSPAPVSQSQVLRHPDPPALPPRSMHGLHGGEQHGPERESSPNSPDVLENLIGLLADRGIEVPQAVVQALTEEGRVTQSSCEVDRLPGEAVRADLDQVEGARPESREAEGPQERGGVSFQELEEYEVLGEEDTESNAPQAEVSKFGLAVDAIHNLNPLSIPSTSKGPEKECDFERLFAVGGREAKEPARLNLYHKVRTIHESVKARFLNSAQLNKSLLSLMPGRRKKYATPDYPSLGAAPTVNPNLARISEPVSVKRALNFTYEEASRLEAAAKHQLEVSSASFWLLSSLVKMLKGAGFEPEEPRAFDSLIFNLTLSFVNSSYLASSMSTFLHLKRREGLLGHFPPHVVSCHKQDLFASAMDSPVVFDPPVLDRVIKEVKEDASTSSLVAVSKVTSLPSFSALRNIRKASSNVPAVGKDQAGAGAVRGRGKTQQYQGQSVGRGQKRKGMGSSFSAGTAKSPKRSASTSRGKGFYP